MPYAEDREKINGHGWVEINYDGIWTPFEPQWGINIESNNHAVEYYNKFPVIYQSMPQTTKKPEVLE